MRDDGIAEYRTEVFNVKIEKNGTMDSALRHATSKGDAGEG